MYLVLSRRIAVLLFFLLIPLSSAANARFPAHQRELDQLAPSAHTVLEIDGPHTVPLQFTIAHTARQSRALRGLLLQGGSVRITTVREGPPDTVGWYEKSSNTIYLVVPNKDSFRRISLVSVVGHELTHKIFRSKGIPNSLLEEGFCRWMHQKIAHESDPSTPEPDSAEEIVASVMRLYEDENRPPSVPEFFPLVASLESSAMLPAGSQAAATQLHAVLQAKLARQGY